MIKLQDFFWPGLPFVNFDEFCLTPGQLEMMWCVKMIRSLAYNLRTKWFYEWKLWHDILFKIHTLNSLTFPWHLPLFRISLTFFQIPWQFPDLEKINFSLTFPWRVATLLLKAISTGPDPTISPHSWNFTHNTTHLQVTPPHSYTQRTICALWLHASQSELSCYIFISGALCDLVVDSIVFHYIHDICTEINTICFKSDSCLYPPLDKQLI